MANETIEYRATLDASQAQAGLDKLRQSAEAMGGGLSKLDLSMAGVRKGASQMKETLEKQAAAVAILSSSMGAANKETQQMIQLGGSLLAAFGAGGPYGLAFAAGLAGVNALTKAWDDQIAKQDEALRKQYDFAAKTYAMIKDLDEKARLAGLSDVGRAVDAPQRALAETRASIASKQAQIAGMTPFMQRSDVAAGLYRDISALKQLEQRQVEAVAQARADAMKAAGVGYDKFGNIVPLKTPAARTDGHGNAVEPKISGGGVGDPTRKILEARVGMRGMSIAAPMGTGSLMGGGGFGVAADNPFAEEMRIMEMRKAMWADFGLFASETLGEVEDDYRDLAMSTTSMLINQFGDYIEAKVEGARDAEAMLAKLVLKGIGDQLVGLGTKQMFEGAGLAIGSAGADPRGWGLLALGATATAAGVSMGAGAAAIKPPMADIPTTGGTRSSGGGGGGGGTVVNITYGGASGPTADHGAAAVEAALRRARRRGMS